ncbi:MAG: transketolase C-terminal domain-containing protein [Candidatus Hodarchaeota archaeon]
MELIKTEYDMKPGKTVFMGNEAMAEGALAAGCRFFAGYPITPQNDVPQRMSERLPQLGGRFIQMEDEIGSIAAVIGASFAGLKAMTSTSGPGFSLMQECMSWAACVEVPLVVCDVQRTGPGSGIVSLPHHSDILQAHYGGNGEYQVIAYAPSNAQELFDFTIDAFNDSETWRVPAIVFSDSWLGHIFEEVVIPTPEELKERIVERKSYQGDLKDYLPFSYKKGDEFIIPEPPKLGEDNFPDWLPSVSHGPNSMATEDTKVSFKMVEALNDKILKNENKIVKTKSIHMEDAEIAVIAYGLPSRPALRAITQAREEGIKVGLLRLLTVWPFPCKTIEELSKKVNKILLIEINWGQLLPYVKANTDCEAGAEVSFLSEISKLHEPAQILKKIKELAQ